MRITITVRHTEVDDDLRAHTRELVGKVVKLVRRPHHAQVIFTQDHGKAGVEIEIHAPRGRVHVAKSQAADLLSDEVIPADPHRRPVALVGAGPDLVDPERRVPTAEEQRRRQRRDGGHVDVFGEEEHREAHRAVLGVVTRDELLFRLREIERSAISFRDPGGHINQKSDGLKEHEERRWDRTEGPPGIRPNCSPRPGGRSRGLRRTLNRTSSALRLSNSAQDRGTCQEE